MRLTVGREEPGVYWRRRAIAVGALLALVMVIAIACRAIGSGDDDTDTENTSSETVLNEEATVPADDATPSRDVKRPYVDGEEPDEEEPEPEGPADCEENDVSLQVVPAYESAAAGTDVPTSVLVANGSSQPCLAPIDELALVALAGTEQVFSSADCGDDSDIQSNELPAGDGEMAQFNFQGIASAEGCAGEARRLPSGDYELKAVMADWESEPVTITLD
ncbi:hypothetical protein [Natronoglycomyces albus]|uniref:Uncharacterized protein n=1 Tax=Natronoglycomyces albus TaxID=2811108 RepID=A0A895XRS7_9ACTN|nr:hypothetical protein [Natronoglycomyces albus]QSB05266.1 hypothetical protein JQS30_16175 [Natronoglycomyces albus]